MKHLTVVVSSSVVLLTGSGCYSARSTSSRTIGDTIAAASGAALGYVASDGNKIATVGGAAAGVVAKRYADDVLDKEEQKKLQAAYDAAHAQATRELYDATQHLQAESTAEASAPSEDAVYLPTQIPERKVNGVILDSTTEYIRISDSSKK
jgi:hypothetical protein